MNELTELLEDRKRKKEISGGKRAKRIGIG